MNQACSTYWLPLEHAGFYQTFEAVVVEVHRLQQIGRSYCQV